MEGSYLIPRSMCSWTPKPKAPVLEKLPFLSSYSLTFNPRSRISSALGPRTVQWHEIFSLRRIPKVRTVYRALMMMKNDLMFLIYLREDRGLASKLFQDLGGSSKSITRLTV